MDQANEPTPFGLLFEEPASQPRSPITPIYDEETNLSYVEDPDGRRVPYVEFTGTVGTETHTRIARETPDEDEDRLAQFAGTHTATAIESEATDTDPEEDSGLLLGSLGTESVTLVESESTDTDPEDDQGYSFIARRFSVIGTDTFTEEDQESTDID